MQRLSGSALRTCVSVAARASSPGAHSLRKISTVAPPGGGPNARSLLALDENTIRPFVQPNAHVSPTATVIGSVVVNDKTAVLPGATLRGDLGLVSVGAHCVIGENASVVATGERAAAAGSVSPADAAASGLPMTADVDVGDLTRVGAGAVLHSCMLEGENDVGAGAVVGSRAVIGRGACVAARAVVAPGTTVPDAELWAGNPAKFVRGLSGPEVEEHSKTIMSRYAVLRRHASEFLPVGTAYWEKERIEKEKSVVKAV